MVIRHLTVLRKFPLQCYNLLCHCERLDKTIRGKVDSYAYRILSGLPTTCMIM